MSDATLTTKMKAAEGDLLRISQDGVFIIVDIRPDSDHFGEGWDLYLTTKQAKRLIKELLNRV